MSQRRNMTHSQQQRMLTELRRQEDQREQQTKLITKERQIQANLVTEDRLEKKRYLRKVQDELHETQIEDALLKVWIQLANVMLVQLVRTPVTVPNVMSASLSQAEEDRIYKQKQLEQEERDRKSTRLNSSHL